MSTSTVVETATKEVISADISTETSMTTAAMFSSESVFVPTPAATHQMVQFSSGNPRIEETRGIMYLFPQCDDDPSNLPVQRNPLVCVLAVPNHMTYADFCQFCGSFVQQMLGMRIVRSDGMEDQYSVLIKFDEQSSADNFFKHFNRRKFSSLEVDVCQIQYTVDVQYTGSIEHSQGSLSSPAEEHSCPVCLERLDQDASGILTTICNHSFHCSCISKWADSSCPVCRYCQQQHEKSTCSVCGTTENLWICVICGYVGCGRYKEGHAINHWKETQHCYSSEVETQRVWDYVGDNYVHRLIQSKTDGKLVELNFHCTYASHASGNCECSADAGIDEALFNSKFDAIVTEYNDLLTSQLENQRKYFEAQLQEVKDETEKEISRAVDKAVKSKLQKLQTKLDKCMVEKKFHDDINENLIKNQEMWTTKIRQIEEREQAAVRKKEKKIQVLEEQLKDIMLKIEGSDSSVTQEQDEKTSDDIKEGTVLPLPASAATVSSPSRKSSSSKQSSRQRKRHQHGHPSSLQLLL